VSLITCEPLVEVDTSRPGALPFNREGASASAGALSFSVAMVILCLAGGEISWKPPRPATPG
jgi:hypothetical protein